MKKLTWSGMLLCSLVAFGSAPACGGSSGGDGDGDGDGDGAGGSGDGDTPATGGTGDGDGDAPATGGSGDGDGDGDGDAPSSACVAYCTTWFGSVACNTHVEANNQYEDQDDCETRCDAFTTVVTECRAIHLGYAVLGSPEDHCGHAAESPTANCTP